MKSKNILSRFYKPYVLGHWLTLHQEKKAARNEGPNSRDCEFVSNEHAFRIIESFMETSGLPMNFTVCRESRMDNAYATMDNAGRRFIVYDYAFLQRLNSDANNIETKTILAHEIGHHLGAHTLFLEDLDYRKKKEQYCKPDTETYDPIRCADLSRKYHEMSRKQELEADRFAGYMMFKAGASLDQVINTYKKIIQENDDSSSTHPKLSLRIEALNYGFELAKNKIHQKGPIDLAGIKGSKIEIEFTRTSTMDRNRLFDRIKHFGIWLPMNEISKNSLGIYNTGYQEPNYPETEKIVSYLGIGGSYPGINNDRTGEYFEPVKVEWVLSDDKRIKYHPLWGIHLKHGILNLILFNEDDEPKVVYSCQFKEDSISFEEIRMIFLEVYRHGWEKILNKEKL